MSTDEELERPERLLTPRQRASPITLAPDPSDEELARDFALSSADRKQVLRCRGDRHRVSFAVQLCVLRLHGRFLRDYGGVPVRIVNYLGRQLGLPPVLFLAAPRREATDLEHERRIRDYLGFQVFDHATAERLERWIEARAHEGLLPRELLARAEETLRAWKVVLPAPRSLERLVIGVVARGRQTLFERITARLDPTMLSQIDALVEVAPHSHRSELFDFKQYPPEATASAMAAHLERYQRLSALEVGRIDLTGASPRLVQYLAEVTGRYDAQSLKRFAPAKRYAMVGCFLVEAHKTLLDQLVAMNDQFLTTMNRRARNAHDARYRDLRKRAKDGVETVLSAIERLLGPTLDRSASVDEVLADLDELRLGEAVARCREFTRLEERGYVDELRRLYPGLRRYIPAFFALGFEGELGAAPLLAALEVARTLNVRGARDLPRDAPTEFIPKGWKAAFPAPGCAPDRRLWEIALAFAVRDALRSGDVYLPDSRRHVSFWNLCYGQGQWTEQRTSAYAQLGLSTEADGVLDGLAREFDLVARQVERGLSNNPFASIDKDRFKLKRIDALEIPDRVRALRRVIETSLPRVRIETVLETVDRSCGFTQALTPLGGYVPRSENLSIAKLAALIAHGTNLGVAAMGHSTDGVTVEMLQHVTKWFLREETLKAANAVVVEYHHDLTRSWIWGGGTVSSSDGQRFGVQGSSLLASFYPRYFGYYDRAVTVYTHVADQYSVFGTQVISCAPREALHVLDGLLENDTVLRPREHSTDTHGYTEHIFGLSYLLGYSFMPRIRDLADQRLYTMDRAATYGPLDAVVRAAADLDVIREQWDQLVRVAASLRNRLAPAHIVVRRLASSAPSDRLAKALTALGRIVKTIFILRYIQEEDLRRRVQLQLNRGESRHELARKLFFANQGEFRSGDYEEIMNKASCLSLLSNAVLVWNTVQIGRIVDQLRKAGDEILDEDLARISPLMHGHVIPNGTYFNRPNQGVNMAHNTLP